jgi:hypothetical protein
MNNNYHFLKPQMAYKSKSQYKKDGYEEKHLSENWSNCIDCNITHAANKNDQWIDH